MLPVLGFGTMDLRGPPWGLAVDDSVAGQILNAAVDAGAFLIDTSIDYGRSEELIGTYLGHRRDEIFLASKCGCMLDPPPDVPPPFPHDYSQANIRAGTELSLRRLRTDHLDLLQVHTSPSRSQMELEGTIETLQSLQTAGTTRLIGMSGGLPNLPDHIAMGVFDVFQVPYSAVRRETEGLITQASDAGSGIIVRSGAGRGGASPPAHSGRSPRVPANEAERLWALPGLRELLGNMTQLEFLLRFSLSHPDVTSVLIGTTKVEHLRADLAIAAKGPLPATSYLQAREILDSQAPS